MTWVGLCSWIDGKLTHLEFVVIGRVFSELLHLLHGCLEFGRERYGHCGYRRWVWCCRRKCGLEMLACAINFGGIRNLSFGLC